MKNIFITAVLALTAASATANSDFKTAINPEWIPIYTVSLVERLKTASSIQSSKRHYCDPKQVESKTKNLQFQLDRLQVRENTIKFDKELLRIRKANKTFDGMSLLFSFYENGLPDLIRIYNRSLFDYNDLHVFCGLEPVELVPQNKITTDYESPYITADRFPPEYEEIKARLFGNNK